MAPPDRAGRAAHTRREILSQPEAWTSALDALRAHAGDARQLYREGRYAAVVFAGCGSSYYLALAAAALCQELTGVPARGLPASEVWLYPRSAYGARDLDPGRTLLVAVSRSGETSETVRACEAFRAGGGGEVLTLTCYPGSALTRLGSLSLVFPSAQEESLAQTRAFSTLYLATVALSALWGGGDDLFEELSRLPLACQSLLTDYASLARAWGSDLALDRFYFLGSGQRYGLACELSLKMKEMSLSHSEPFHFLEFRHGPKSMLTPTTALVGLLSESNREHELRVLDEAAAMGARVLTLGEAHSDVAFRSGLDEAARNVLYLPIGQLIALERALAKGLDPDRPHNLSAVVRLS